ncbi:FmdB family zinc ribbon protein [Aquisphaera insulae]|uniref:FmdB family zinc ribbon protein n=1 Tax=Aquisphaera insulae TaxID=2712864 RepID=UPI0013ECA4C5|nr:zinc ribbon domain-containing protein [Aquisphaera insulae]
MPIYEYRCEPCDHTFETLIRSTGDVARCPKCGNIDVAKEFSVPAAAQVGRGGSALPVCAPSGPAAGCGRPECGSGSCAFG